MVYFIKAMDRETCISLDETFDVDWREPNGIRQDGKYDVLLNKATIEVRNNKAYICYNDVRILLFPNAYAQLILS